MNLYLSQLKSLLLKIYKLKRKRHLFISLFCEILCIAVYLSVLRFIGKKDYVYDEADSVKSISINNYGLIGISGTIGIIMPFVLNCTDSQEKFVNNLANNKVFTENIYLRYKIYNDVNTLLNNLNQEIAKENLISLVIFNDCFSDYTIRFPGEIAIDPKVPNIDHYYNNRDVSNAESDKYLKIFSPLQVVINQAIIQTKTNKMIDLDVKVGKLSKPKIKLLLNEEFFTSNKLTLKALGYSLTFIIQIMSIMTGIINEKNKGIEQGLIAIGVHPSTIWLSWEIFYLPLNIIFSLIAAFIESGGMFSTVNFLLSFMLIFAYGLACYAFAVLTTKIFKENKFAILIVSIVFFGLLLSDGYIYKLDNNYQYLLILLCIFVSPLNITYGITKLIEEKDHKNRVAFEGFILLICSAIFYHLIIIGIEFFSFKFSNLFKSKGDFTQSQLYTDDIEEDPNNCGKPLIEVKSIFKVYKNKNKSNLFSNEKINVLKGVSFNVYNNEIFGILGHNAAGKSTLF